MQCMESPHVCVFVRLVWMGLGVRRAVGAYVCVERWDSEYNRVCDVICVSKGFAYCWLGLMPACGGPWSCVCLQRNGWTPFRIAQRKGHADVAAVLAEAGGR